MIDLYLASGSPRRFDLLSSMGLSVECCPANIDESILLNESPADYVQRLAKEKARFSYHKTIDRIHHIPFLGADTIVVCEGEIFGKPKDKDDAFRMWKAMSGKQHQVLTAIALVVDLDASITDTQNAANKLAPSKVSDHEVQMLSCNEVWFKSLTEQEMQTYWLSGEPQDKAGAYGIQGRASAWVKSIKGSYSGIMGLPLFETNACLKKFGLHWI